MYIQNDTVKVSNTEYMKVNVKKWGNSLALRIPKIVADNLNLRDGSLLEMEIENDCLTLVPEKKYTIEDFMLGLDKETRHEPDDLDPRGKELI